MLGQGRLHQWGELGAPVPVGGVGQGKTHAGRVDRHKATSAVERLGPRRQVAQDAITPGLGHCVAVDRGA